MLLKISHIYLRAQSAEKTPVIDISKQPGECVSNLFKQLFLRRDWIKISYLLLLHFAIVALPCTAAATEPLTVFEKVQPSEAARLLIAQRKYNRALFVLESNIATNANPRHPAKILVGDWHLDPTGQDLAFRELTAEQVRNVHFADLHNLAACALYNLKRVPEAEASYRKAIELNPQHGLAYCNLGGILIKQNRLDDAFAVFNQVLKINERYHIAYRNRAILYRERNQFALEQKDLEAFHRWSKQNEREALNLSYLSRFQYMHSLLSKKAPTARNLVALGVINKEMHRLKESEDCYLRAIALDQKLPEAHWSYGVLLTAQKRYNQAIKELTKAISLESNAAILLFSRAIAYRQSQQFVKAVADYSEVIALNPKAPGLLKEAYFSRAGCRGELKDFTAAIQDINSALALKPNRTEKALMLSNRGALYEGLGKKGLAVKDYEQAIALSPDDKSIYARRGKIMLGLGEYEQATVDLGAASRTDVAEVSKLPPPEADLKAQIVQYDKLIKMFPRTAIASIYNRGLLYLTLGDATRAAADMQAVVEQSKETNATADYAVCYGSIALRMQNKNTEADRLLQAYEKRLRTEPVPKEVRYLLNKALPTSQAQPGKSSGSNSMRQILSGDDKHKTRVLTLLGLDAGSRKDMNEAMKFLTLVRNSGDPSMDEFALAVSYLKRLEKN